MGCISIFPSPAGGGEHWKYVLIIELAASILSPRSKRNNKCCIFGKTRGMKSALQINITFDQILSLVKQLPKKDKIKLTKALEKEGIDSKLSRLLKTFRSKDLDLKTINEEVEIVRQHIYDRQKR